MAKLTSKQRNNLPAVEFAGPKRSFPIPDKAHAVDAKARATQGVKAGTLAPSTAAKIKAKANAKLGKTSSHPSDRVSAGSGRDHYKPRG